MNPHQRTLALAHEDARRYQREAQFIEFLRKNVFPFLATPFEMYPPGVTQADVDLYLARYDSLTSG